MLRKHYRAIAELCERFKPGSLFVWALCAYFASDNLDFDCGRFIAACGSQEEDADEAS